MRRTILCQLAIILFASPLVASADDWPHWLGPNRNGSSPEKNLLTDWPKGGPKLLWKVSGGEGYSTVAVVGKRAYTLVQRDGKEWVVCLDVKDGKTVWQQAIANAYRNDYGNGPRSTPTVVDGHIYVQSVSGPLVCLEAVKGNIVWQHNLLKDFSGKNISWGLSASPLVEGDLVYVLPSSKKAALAAYHKKTGKLVWKGGSGNASYASPIPAMVGGKKQIIFFNAFGLTAVEPNDGEPIWRMPWETEFECNICTPLVIGNRIFVTSGEKVGCAMLALSAAGKPTVDWESRGKNSVMMNYWANSVLHDGHLYGVSGEFNKPIHLNCVDAKTGDLKWSQQRFGLSAITLAAGHLFISTKKGDIVLVEATPKGYNEKARLEGFLGQNRTSPTISNGRMFLRDRRSIYCVDVSK